LEKVGIGLDKSSLYENNMKLKDNRAPIKDALTVKILPKNKSNNY